MKIIPRTGGYAMNIESVKTLFTLFSGEDSLEKYMPVITLAVSEVEAILISPDESDIRLDFLCAAVANFRLRQINASRDRTEFTYAGKMTAGDTEKSSLRCAEALLRDYMSLCKGLIRNESFTFFGIG